MFIERKIYDLAADDWPILEPDGKIYYQKAHLHKGSFIARSGGSLILKTEKTTKESAGIRIILKTIPNAWYKLRVRAALYKGDQAFVLAQDLHINYIKTRAKLTLGAPLIPRSYFFPPSFSLPPTLSTEAQEALAPLAPTAPLAREPREMTEYLLYFKAISEDTIVGLLFFSKDIEYEIGITDFICSEFSYSGTDATSESVADAASRNKQGILLDFPLADSFNANLGKDLRRFGLGTYPDEVRLISCKVPRNSRAKQIPLYILTIGGSSWLYLRRIEIDVDFETYILEIEVEEIHKDLYLEHIKFNNIKLPIRIQACWLTIPRPVSKADIRNDQEEEVGAKEEAGTIEIRTDGKILFYYPDLHGFYPCICIDESLYNLSGTSDISINLSGR